MIPPKGAIILNSYTVLLKRASASWQGLHEFAEFSYPTISYLIIMWMLWDDLFIMELDLDKYKECVCIDKLPLLLGVKWRATNLFITRYEMGYIFST